MGNVREGVSGVMGRLLGGQGEAVPTLVEDVTLVVHAVRGEGLRVEVGVAHGDRLVGGGVPGLTRSWAWRSGEPSGQMRAA